MKDRKLLNIELGRVTAEEYRKLPDSGIEIILDNIRSAHNVGSVFRSADSFKADKVWLCGICATPPSAEIHKSALGAEFSVEWGYEKDTLSLVKRLKEEGYTVLSVEQTVNSVMLDKFKPETGRKYALVFGNEVDGVQQEVVDASDGVLEIPQYGTKHSLNISVSAGIVLWHIASALHSEA
ncbi:MAG: TrmH family RNA methyltransferase [Bacteroidales bacterium]|nr:TrmH family RNA methyltransferase [Bacteroidales bacterium]